MSTEIYNRNLLLFCLFVCGLMYIDSYLVPLKDDPKTVLRQDYYSTSSLRHTYKTFEIETESGYFPITGRASNMINDGQKIVLMRSFVTNSVQKIRLSQNEHDRTVEVGFLRARSGILGIPILCLCIIVNLSANKRLVREGKRKYLPYVWLTGLWVLLGFHLGLESLFR
jgi:hypothetical protein